MKSEKIEEIIYNENKEKIGELKKLNDGLFEIIEDENVSEKFKLQIESTEKIKENKSILVSYENNTQDEINKKLDEMKKSRGINKDTNKVSFADLDFL